MGESRREQSENKSTEIMHATCILYSSFILSQFFILFFPFLKKNVDIVVVKWSCVNVLIFLILEGVGFDIINFSSNDHMHLVPKEVR